MKIAEQRVVTWRGIARHVDNARASPLDAKHRRNQ